MATALFSFRRRMVSYYRMWWFRRRRQLYVTCTECGATMEADAHELLVSGHYRAAVFASRLQLERALQNLCHEFRSDNSWRHAARSGSLMAQFLRVHGRITAKTANRVGGAYAKASKVVHGRACPSDRAYEIVRDIAAVLRLLDLPQETCDTAKVITGFAAVEGGVA